MVEWPDLFRLHGKVAIVTGASSGIGLAIAELFAEAGASVVIASNDADGCATAAARITGALAVTCDVTVPADLAGLVARTVEAFGGVDILVCNAGAAPHFGPLGSASDAEFDVTMDINLRHAVRLTGLVAPIMAARGGGAIILTSSLSGLRGNKAIGLYGLSKAALAQLARNLAVEWGPSNIRANAISPGLIRTNFASGIADNPRVLERRLQMTPLRRMGEASEVAGAALFLASPAGAFVTGHNLVIDGGTLITDGN